MIYELKVFALQVWAAYKGENLIEMVDPVLKKAYPEEEAIRFLKVGLLCVQETAKLRPRMTEAVQMLSNNNIVDDMQAIRITKPGFVADLRNVKIRQHQQFCQSSIGGANSCGTTSIWSSANLAR